MARPRWRRTDRSILIELGVGAAAERGPTYERTPPGVDARTDPCAECRAAFRAIGAAAILALIGVALPAFTLGSPPTVGPGLLEPYPTKPVIGWQVSPAIAGRGTTFVTFGPFTNDASGLPDFSDPGHVALLGAVQAGSSISDLFALDPRDGSISWLAPYAGHARYRGCADSLLSGAMVCVAQGAVPGSAELFAIRVSDGRELVRWDAPGWARSVEVSLAGVVLAGVSADGAELLIGRYDAWTGAERWSRSVPLDAPALGGADVAVVVPPSIQLVGERIIASISSIVTVLDVTDGALLRAPVQGAASTLPGGGALLQYASPDQPRASNDYPGSWHWTSGEIFPADGGAGMAVPGMAGALIPTLGRGSSSALILTENDAVTAYSSTGARSWNIPADPGLATFWPLIVTPLGLLESADNSLQLRDLSTGALRWEVSEPTSFIEEVLGSDGKRIVVVRRQSVQDVRDLAAIDGATGKTLWSIAVAPDQLVATAGGRLVLVSPTSIRGLEPTRP